MATTEKTTVEIETIIKAPVEKVWKAWTEPQNIIRWAYASDDWHTPYAENDLHVGGKFLSRMEAKDGSFGFDFGGEYTKVDTHKLIEYVMEDGRKVNVAFMVKGNDTQVIETFEAESQNPVEMQRAGWQAILDNFKKYVESKMEILNFEIRINAPVEIVYSTMFDEKHYKEWTAEFNPTSHFKGSWNKGSKILFIGADKDGNKGGMVSRIKENIPNKFVSIEHLGILQGDKEITTGTDVEGWAGALENYAFKGENSKTHLLIDMDSNQEFKSYFQETWPKALKKLKAICENIYSDKIKN